MKNSNTIVQGLPLFEYQLVLNPHEELRNKIMNVKQHVFDTYKASAALYSKPFVTLVYFTGLQQMEAKVVNRLQTIAMGCPPLKIELKDFGSFPSHSIFINVTSKVQAQQLVKTIRTEARHLMKINSDHAPHFMMEPTMAIARKLLPWQFEKAWLQYRHRSFTGRFIADAMLLLKRPVGGTRYEIVSRFEFRHLPVTTTQGMLFA